jgi:hypothetical protein
LIPIAPKGPRGMTIAIGYRCKGGVILCADTQETYDGTKRNVPKLIVKESTVPDGPPLVLAVAGAGHGPFIDRLVSDMWKAIAGRRNTEQAIAAADDAILDHYDRYSKSFGGKIPDAELIYAIRSTEDARLFHASGQIVNECQSQSVGVGHILADYLNDRLHIRDIGLSYMLQVAVYILKETKKYVDGCGGESHIMVLPDSGPYLPILPQDEVEKREKMSQSPDVTLDILKQMVSNPDNSLQEVERLLDIFFKATLRKAKEFRQNEVTIPELVDRINAASRNEQSSN